MTHTPEQLDAIIAGLSENMRNALWYVKTASDGVRMVANGLAVEVVFNGFRLTPAGAQLALDPGETLDMEDFPHD